MGLMKRNICFSVCLLLIASLCPIFTTTAYADGLPTTKTASITKTLSGVHATSDFPTTIPYDDGTYYGTLTRQDNTLRCITRSTPTVTYTSQSDTTYLIDKPPTGQYNFPATYAGFYFDPVSGQHFPATLYLSGAPYFAGIAVSNYQYWEHHGYQYDPENHSKLGYLSNNSSTYYGGQYRYSDPPRQPTDYYGPPAEEGLGWVQYKAPEWDGALQDATQEPWRSLCLFWHGVARFISDTTGTQNRYRKPVLLFYRRSATCQYIYQAYSGTATVTDTQITYTGAVSLKLPDLVISSLTTDKTSYNSGETITVTAVVKNQGIANSGSNTARLALGPYTVDRNVSSLAAGATQPITYTVQAPSYESATTLAATVTADALNTVTESDESNNSASRSITINAALPDLIIESVNTADWYAGMDVLVSAKVTNLFGQAVPAVTIRLTAGTVNVNETISVPGNGSNLAVFRFTVPSPLNPPGSMPMLVTITADPDNVIPEVNEANNTWSKKQTISLVPTSVIIDPDSVALEQDYLNRNKTIPQVIPSTYHAWQEVRLENGIYIVKNYWARLDTIFSIAPDPKIAYPGNSRLMESGFGVQAYCKTTLTTNYDHPEKLIGPQMVWVYHPESAYGQVQWRNTRDDLAISSGTKGDKVAEWQCAVNPYSVTGRRLHYTPLWFPDGPYTALLQAAYAWSPVGQMVDYRSDSVTIEGDMYDRVAVVRR